MEKYSEIFVMELDHLWFTEVIPLEKHVNIENFSLLIEKRMMLRSITQECKKINDTDLFPPCFFQISYFYQCLKRKFVLKIHEIRNDDAYSSIFWPQKMEKIAGLDPSFKENFKMQILKIFFVK